MPKDIHMLVSMINMKLRDDDMQLSHVLSIYDLDETEFMKRLDENEYFYVMPFLKNVEMMSTSNLKTYKKQELSKLEGPTIKL